MNLFSPTEKQRTALNRLWTRYRRAVRAKKSSRDPDAIQREIEDLIGANLSGYDTAADARAEANKLTNRRANA